MPSPSSGMSKSTAGCLMCRVSLSPDLEYFLFKMYHRKPSNWHKLLSLHGGSRCRLFDQSSGLSPYKYGTDTNVFDTGRYVSDLSVSSQYVATMSSKFLCLLSKTIATVLTCLLFGCHYCHIPQQILFWSFFHKALCFFSFSSPEPLTGRRMSATSLLKPAEVSKMNNRLSHILFRRRPKSPDAATYLSILSILYIWSLKPSHIYI
jgi:hypothetical protein